MESSLADESLLKEKMPVKRTVQSEHTIPEVVNEAIDALTESLPSILAQEALPGQLSD